MTATDGVFPLVPRRRVRSFGASPHPSSRRGPGIEVAATRPYRRGDSFRSIDWKATARLSSARGADEFVVRDHFSDHLPRVVIFVDRRADMSLFPSSLPWLDKPAAVAAIGELIVRSTLAVGGVPGYLAVGDPDEPRWIPPRVRSDAAHVESELRAAGRFTAPEDSVERGLAFLIAVRHHLPAGSFVFVISDFLAPLPSEAWQRALDRQWELVPVVVQDALWEQSFPRLAGVAVPVARGTRSRELMRLTRKQAEELRGVHEARLEALRSAFAALGSDPAIVSSPDPEHVLATFVAWHEARFAAPVGG